MNFRLVPQIPKPLDLCDLLLELYFFSLKVYNFLPFLLPGSLDTLLQLMLLQRRNKTKRSLFCYVVAMLKYCTAGNFCLEKIFNFSLPAFMGKLFIWWIFCSTLMDHGNLYHMGKIHSCLFNVYPKSNQVAYAHRFQCAGGNTVQYVMIRI